MGKIIVALRYVFILILDYFIVPCLYVFVTRLRNFYVLIGIMAERIVVTIRIPKVNIIDPVT